MSPYPKTGMLLWMPVKMAECAQDLVSKAVTKGGYGPSGTAFSMGRV